jgi:DNA-binding transcriptional MerR regulator
MKANGAKPYLKIGDVARMVGVSPSVIRTWESLGLTRPQRTESKYRLYTAEDVKLLKRARFLCASAAECAGYCGTPQA